MSKDDTQRRSASYSPNMNAPTRKKKSSRALVGFLLAVLLPPIGIAYLWRADVFRVRGRMLLTGLSTLIMALWIVGLTPQQDVLQQSPQPMRSVAVTRAPDDGVVDALTNLDELLIQRKREQDKAAGITPEPATTDDPEYLAQQEALLDLVVYSVWGNSARYYHEKTVCGTQSNRRELTLRDAMYNGMAACPNCRPPVYVGPLHDNQ